MTTLREAALLAIANIGKISRTVGLKNYWTDDDEGEHRLDTLADAATEALQQALAQPESEPAEMQNLDPLAVFTIEVEMGAWHPDEMAERVAIALKQSKWQLPEPVDAQQVAVPPGYAFVPIEPTEAMLAAYYREFNRGEGREAWLTLLKAAPQPAYVPLSDDEITRLWIRANSTLGGTVEAFTRLVEQAVRGGT